MTIKYLIYIFFVYLLLSFCFGVFAESSIRINEVYVDTSPQSIELINISSTSADISGWYLDDAGGTTYFTVPSNTYLYPSSCAVFSSDFNLNKTSSDSARLFSNSYPPSNSLSLLIDSFSYNKGPGAGISYVRIPDGSTNWATEEESLGNYNESRMTCIALPTITPTTILYPTVQPQVLNTSTPQPHSLPTPSPLHNVYISEFMAYPDAGNNEWVELYNDNDVDVDITDWYIDDIEGGGSVPKKISISILKKNYAVIDFSSSVFNNDADQVRLLDPQKNVVDEVEYQGVIQGKTYGRSAWDSDTLCHQEPTKNLINNMCLEALSPPHIVAPSSLQAQEVKKSISRNFSSAQSIQNTSSFVVLRPQSSTQTVFDSEVLGVANQVIVPVKQQFFPVIAGVYSILTIVSVLVKMRYV